MRSACVHAHLSLQANEISFNWRAVLARIALKISTVVASSKASCLMASTSDAELFSSEEGSRAASPEIPLLVSLHNQHLGVQGRDALCPQHFVTYQVIQTRRLAATYMYEEQAG